MRSNSASHIIFEFRFTGSYRTTQHGSNDDGKNGIGRLLLKPLIENNLKNWLSFVVVSGGTAAKSDLDTLNASMKSS